MGRIWLLSVSLVFSACAAVGERPAPANRPGPVEWVYSEAAKVAFARSETTVAQYRACVKAGKCRVPEGRDANPACNWGYTDREAHPVNCVDLVQAQAFCAWTGGRLPTPNEWESEASDEDQRKYPWGFDAPCCELAVGEACGCGGSRPVCSRPEGNSVSGLCDMAGNVWEWTDHREADGQEIRGGGFVLGDVHHMRAAGRFLANPAARYRHIGIRCVKDVQPPARVDEPVPELTWVSDPESDLVFTRDRIRSDQYAECVEAGKCTTPHYDDGRCIFWHWQHRQWEEGAVPKRFRAAGHPVVCVDFFQAQSYCRWVGGRLPTEEELAARGRLPPCGPKAKGCEEPKLLWATPTGRDGSGEAVVRGSCLYKGESQAARLGWQGDNANACVSFRCVRKESTR